MNIYDELVAAGCETAHHESDLYVKASREARRIIDGALADKRLANKPTLFRADDGTGLWYEIAFAYRPFWIERGLS